jgi:hypothetical protein
MPRETIGKPTGFWGNYSVKFRAFPWSISTEALLQPQIHIRHVDRPPIYVG